MPRETALEPSLFLVSDIPTQRFPAKHPHVRGREGCTNESRPQPLPKRGKRRKTWYDVVVYPHITPSSHVRGRPRSCNRFPRHLSPVTKPVLAFNHSFLVPAITAFDVTSLAGELPLRGSGPYSFNHGSFLPKELILLRHS